MMSLSHFAPFATAFGLTAAHSIWQITLIWIIFKVLESRLNRLHQAMYLLSLAAMFASVAWSVATFVNAFNWNLAAPESTFSAENAASQALPIFEHVASGIESAPVATLWESIQIWLESYSAQIGWVWLLCAVFLWLRLLGGWWLAQRLRRRNVSPAAATFQRLCDHWAKHLKIGPQVRLLESLHVAEPLTLGFWKPIVLFPTGMLLQLSPAQVEALLLHELAHIRRHDYLVNLFQLALEVCFFYHPLFWLLSREARSRREFCCDQVVMSHTSDPILYAKTLTDLQLSFFSPSTPFVMNATGKSHFSDRIFHIVGITPQRTAHSNWLAALILPALLTLCSWWPAGKNGSQPTATTPDKVSVIDSLPPKKTASSSPKPAPSRTNTDMAQPVKTASNRPAVAMEVVKMNMLYIGVDNPLRIAVADVPASELRVQLLGEGSIQGSAGNYNVQVRQPGEVTVRVSRQVGANVDVLVDQKYRVKRIPDPAPRLNGQYKGGTITLQELLEARGIEAMLDNFDFDATCEVVSFDVTVVAKDQNPTVFNVTGKTFPASVKEMFQKLEGAGGAVFFDDIRVKCPGDAAARNVGGLAFKVK